MDEQRSNGVKFLGTTDEHDACDCCGRSNLKVYVVLMFEGACDAVFYGTSCAARALRMPAREVKASAKNADDAARAERERIAREERTVHDAHWQRFLDEHAPGKRGDRFLQIEALGGYGAARDMFVAAGGA